MAHAEQNAGPSDQPTLCASKGSDGSWDFHLPGATAQGSPTRTVASGHYLEETAGGSTYECKDGTWHEVKQFVAQPRPLAVQPVGGVLTQYLNEPATGLPQLVHIQAGGVFTQP